MTTIKLTKLGQCVGIETVNGPARVEIVSDGVFISLPDLVYRHPTIAQVAEDLLDWINNAADEKRCAGSFVRFFAQAAQVADYENYPELVQILRKMKEKYPQYCEPSYRLDVDAEHQI